MYSRRAAVVFCLKKKICIAEFPIFLLAVTSEIIKVRFGKENLIRELFVTCFFHKTCLESATSFLKAYNTQLNKFSII